MGFSARCETDCVRVGAQCFPKHVPPAGVLLLCHGPLCGRPEERVAQRDELPDEGLTRFEEKVVR
jgi:hypothetical protein